MTTASSFPPTATSAGSCSRNSITVGGPRCSKDDGRRMARSSSRVVGPLLNTGLRSTGWTTTSSRSTTIPPPVGSMPTGGRRFSCGPSTAALALACFAGSMLMEADLVQLQRTTGAAIIQRTPVLDVVRIAVDEAMVTWDGRHWHRRPTAMAMADDLIERVPELDSSFALHVLELAVHWLAPSRIGATIVAHDGDHIDWSALDTSTAARTPQLSVCDRRHFSALTTVLRQHDLAVIVDRGGSLRKVAVGLRWTTDAEAAVSSDRGMRHRSAQRYSHDHPTATLVVVSEDGPVSVFRGGALAVTSSADGTSSAESS